MPGEDRHDSWHRPGLWLLRVRNHTGDPAGHLAQGLGRAKPTLYHYQQESSWSSPVPPTGSAVDLCDPEQAPKPCSVAGITLNRAKPQGMLDGGRMGLWEQDEKGRLLLVCK